MVPRGWRLGAFYGPRVYVPLTLSAAGRAAVGLAVRGRRRYREGHVRRRAPPVHRWQPGSPAPRRAVGAEQPYRSAVERRHIGVAVTDGRLDGVQPVELARAQFDGVGAEVLLDPFAAARS